MGIRRSPQSTVVGLVAGPAVSLLDLKDLREGKQAVASVSLSGGLGDPCTGSASLSPTVMCQEKSTVPGCGEQGGESLT